MKTFYLRTTLVVLFAMIILNVNAQSSFIDLSSESNYSIFYNANEVQSLTVIPKASAPAGIPDVGVSFNDIFSLTSYDAESWTSWWNALAAMTYSQEITAVNNAIDILVYSSHNTAQIIVKDGDNMSYSWEGTLKIGEWQTVTIDLSDPKLIGKSIVSIEFLPKTQNAEMYFYPYWGKTRAYDAGTLTIMIPDLNDDTNFSYFYNAGENNMGVINTPEDIKSTMPLVSNEVFQVETFNIGDWWWNSALVFIEPLEIKEGQSMVSYLIYSPNSEVNLITKDENGAELYSFANFNLSFIEPNEWNEIRYDLSGKIGKKISSIEVCARTPNTTVYFYPCWVKKNGSGSGEERILIDNNAPYLSNGLIQIATDSNIKLYNGLGQLEGTTYGTSITAVQGLNIVVVDGVSYKLLNNK